MQAQRDIRLARERFACLKERCAKFQRVYGAWHAKQSNKGVLPRAIDLMRRPEVRAVIEQDGEQDVTFAAFEDKFAEWSVEWKDECDEKLRELVLASPAFNDRIPEGVDPLSLASVVFTCRTCNTTKSTHRRIQMPPLYPAILSHKCLYRRSWESLSMDPFQRAAVAVSKATLYTNHTFWSCDSLELDTRWSERMGRIITAFNKDPNIATREEMDAVDDVRVCCFKCPMDTRYLRRVMNWRCAVSGLWRRAAGRKWWFAAVRKRTLLLLARRCARLGGDESFERKDTGGMRSVP